MSLVVVTSNRFADAIADRVMDGPYGQKLSEDFLASTGMRNLCFGEVGRTGVAIDTIDDMRTAFNGFDVVARGNLVERLLLLIGVPRQCLGPIIEQFADKEGELILRGFPLRAGLLREPFLDSVPNFPIDDGGMKSIV